MGADMTILRILIAFILLSSIAYAQNFEIDWYVMASGGGEMSSTGFSINGTIGQPIIGESSSAGYTIESGFWVGAGGIACEYAVGDVNWSGSFNGLDITYGVAYLKGGNPPLCEPCALCPDWYYCGDVNASCSYNGLDITYGVSYLKGGPALMPCDDCPPAGWTVASTPGRIAKPASILNVRQKPR